MKNISLSILILPLLLGINTNTDASEWLGKSKDPWHKMMVVLNEHGLDTTNMGVTTVVSDVTLNSAAADMAKTFGAKKSAKTWESAMVGDVICYYMQQKYTKTNEKHEYFRTRYSTKAGDYARFLSLYPNSSYADEMLWKKILLSALSSWSSAMTANDCRLAQTESLSVSKCTYAGFYHEFTDLTQYVSTVNDWNALMQVRASGGHDDCDAFESFREQHRDHLSAYRHFIDDSIRLCRHANAWRTATKLNTVKAYREYLQAYPYGEFSFQAKNKIKDYEDWTTARQDGSHAAYVTYCEEHPNGDSADVARECMRSIEEPAWQNVSVAYERAKKASAQVSVRTMALKAIDAFLSAYKDGYHYSDATEMRYEMITAIQGESISNKSFQTYGRCSSPYSGIVFLGNIRATSNSITFTLRNKETGKVYERNVKNGEYWTETLPNGVYSIVASCWDVEQNYSGTLTVSGRLYFLSLYVSKSRWGVEFDKDYDEDAEERITKAFLKIWEREDPAGYNSFSSPSLFSPDLIRSLLGH